MTEVPDDTEHSGPVATTPPQGADRRHRRAALALTLALGIALVAAVAGGITAVGSSTADRAGNEAVAAARQVALELTSMKAATAEADLQRLLANSTGEFHDEFVERRQAFVDIVQRARVDTTGEVVTAGLDFERDGTAHVLVAVHSTVRNSAAEQGEPRDYRLGISLEHVDGRWLASKVDFVA
ncbi:hypothetical protein [Pseudonocardia parietis]|uniref:Mce-associated membrane protein n=1 Tax=Pseudonocardia parietis TaxID=570936 RepID=A0ABS4VLK7_9PSEU|nr:hypothetical protein [Pseudonocardia parietis]MBP2364805.1 Mce-associated membrane protein [Pseudonocardia parietis]